MFVASHKKIIIVLGLLFFVAGGAIFLHAFLSSPKLNKKQTAVSETQKSETLESAEVAGEKAAAGEPNTAEPLKDDLPPTPPAEPGSVDEDISPQADGHFVQIGSYQLSLRSENNAPYERASYGPHKSSLCANASKDPYTGLPITSCDVDHVVALAEAHQSGAWTWSADKKRLFSQDATNHLATLSCVNRSKGAKDVAEWSDAWIAQSKACGGYVVTLEGRCQLAIITIKVKFKWRLSVDSDEAEALKRCV